MITVITEVIFLSNQNDHSNHSNCSDYMETGLTNVQKMECQKMECEAFGHKMEI